jgi:hypothetical protein
MKRRLPRILLNTATAASLVLCVATSVILLRSYAGDLAVRRTALHVSPTRQYLSQYTVYVREGDAHVTLESLDEPRVPSRRRDRYLAGNPGGVSWEWWAGPKSDLGFDAGGMGMHTWSGLLGFTWNRPPSSPAPQRQWRSDDFHIDLWPIALLLAPLPILRAIMFAQRRPQRPHPARCPICGYDHRVTPARCPQCERATGGADRA